MNEVINKTSKCESCKHKKSISTMCIGCARYMNNINCLDLFESGIKTEKIQDGHFFKIKTLENSIILFLKSPKKEDEPFNITMTYHQLYYFQKILYREFCEYKDTHPELFKDDRTYNLDKTSI